MDVARATGFLHAQERFFQMDLSRRRAAGELAALVGGRAVPLDRDIRLHRFRAEAKRATELLLASGPSTAGRLHGRRQRRAERAWRRALRVPRSSSDSVTVAA